jgi:Ca-activated chloride channel family protein
VTFNVTANPFFRQLRDADDTAKSDAVAFLRGQRARGGTTLEPAIRAAYRYKDADRPLNVVVLSDGMTEQRERQTLLRLIGERPGSTRVFCIGVGNEVDRALLEQLAQDAGGLAAFVSRGDDFDRQAQAFRRKLMRPAVTNIELDVIGGDLYDLEPRQVPNLYHGMPVRLYGRYRNPGTVALTLRGDIDGESFEKTLEIELPGEEADNPEIERMWAWHRVQSLLKQSDRNGSRPREILDEIVRLGEGFSIVTEYTSFLVLENDAEYERWKIERRNALRVKRDRRHQERVRTELEALRAKANANIGPLTEQPRAAEPQAPRQGMPVTSAPTSRQSSKSRGWDLDLGGGGGGALDPFSVGIVLALGAASYAASRRRRKGGS